MLMLIQNKNYKGSLSGLGTVYPCGPGFNPADPDSECYQCGSGIRLNGTQSACCDLNGQNCVVTDLLTHKLVPGAVVDPGVAAQIAKDMAWVNSPAGQAAYAGGRSNTIPSSWISAVTAAPGAPVPPITPPAPTGDQAIDKGGSVIAPTFLQTGGELVSTVLGQQFLGLPVWLLGIGAVGAILVLKK